MKTAIEKLTLALLMTTLSAAPLLAEPAGDGEQLIETARAAIKAERQATVAEAMQFTDAEAQAFWPIYDGYRAEMDKVGDGLKSLVLEYARLYPDVPDTRARAMLKDLTDLEKKQVSVRAAYLKKFGKVLPAAKTLRLAQVESRLDLALRLELASNIPLVPVEGMLRGTTQVGAAVVEGQGGGLLVATYELRATVTAVNAATRKVTLLDDNGFKQTVKAGPDVINFDQIRVGDQLKLSVTEDLVVEMGDEAEADAAATVVSLAPKGAKPGGVLAEVRRITGQIAAIDPAKRTVTLRFENGTERTLPVRPDVKLGGHKVGERVVFRLTETIAVKVERP